MRQRVRVQPCDLLRGAERARRKQHSKHVCRKVRFTQELAFVLLRGRLRRTARRTSQRWRALQRVQRFCVAEWAALHDRGPLTNAFSVLAFIVGSRRRASCSSSPAAYSIVFLLRMHLMRKSLASPDGAHPFGFAARSCLCALAPRGAELRTRYTRHTPHTRRGSRPACGAGRAASSTAASSTRSVVGPVDRAVLGGCCGRY